MNKVWLIIKREYITRVRNKTFLLSTFLLPIAMLLFIFGSTYFAAKNAENKKNIVVNDASGFMQQYLKGDTTKIQYTFSTTVDTSNYGLKGFDGLLYSVNGNHQQLVLKTPKAAGQFLIGQLKDNLHSAFLNSALQKKNISSIALDSIDYSVNKSFSLVNKDDSNKDSNAVVNIGIGYACGILIYITMIIFGAMVMRGVMEEKTNRIAEVVVSSVKPFQLMMGKILGIGAVGLTQLLLWIILIFVISSSAALFLPHDIMNQVQQIKSNPASLQNNAIQYNEAAKSIANLGSLNWAIIIPCFIFYFLGGYLFYAALFAAVGSVVNEDPQEAQSLMLPLTMPIIFGFIIMSSNINTPDSSAMVWGSIIPFTSPIVMMGRIATLPPIWQMALSIIFLVAGFLFTTWLAARIYRIGILMYGKKPSWKEMLKWAFKK